MALARQLALTNQRLSCDRHEDEALDARCAQPEHHNRVGRIANIQKIGEQERAEPFVLHRRLQSIEPVAVQPLHIDAERRQVRVKHDSSCCRVKSSRTANR